MKIEIVRKEKVFMHGDGTATFEYSLGDKTEVSRLYKNDALKMDHVTTVNLSAELLSKAAVMVERNGMSTEIHINLKE